MGIVHTIPEAAMDYVLYGDNSSVVSDYIQQQLAAMPVAFNAFTQRIRDAAVASYNYLNDTMVKYGIINSLQGSNVNIVDNYIHEINSFEGLQQANPVMQRWIMAHREVRQLYIDQNVDGYSDTYQNVFGKEVGEDDYNYRRVMSGRFVDLPDGSYKRSIYMDDLMPGDRELEYHEKVAIRSTWEHIDNLLAECKFDFTCNSETPVKINR